MKTHSKSDARKVVIAALLGNLGIAVAKFVAAWLSGSTAILAEGVHSLADTGNQGLLLVGMGLAKQHQPQRLPTRSRQGVLLLGLHRGVVVVFRGRRVCGLRRRAQAIRRSRRATARR